ncbi:MAG TPA: flagellar basal body rod protein FlgC [Thermomicrobiales bacterium]|nr:flagellar basal body rod protein FlgC [Thermomicrobiales bacterium]
MSLFDSMQISVSGLSAQRVRMDVIASNIANVDTLETAQGGPYIRKRVRFETTNPATGDIVRVSAFDDVLANRAIGQGVRVSAIEEDPAALELVYDPDNPSADEDGFVLRPDIDLVTEMTDMLSATRAYEANITVLNALKSMAMTALDISR